jgi:hypothetical protein
MVTVGELVKGVLVALGLKPVKFCEAVDGNDDGVGTIDELVVAVEAMLGDVTPTATFSRTRNSTARPTLTRTPTATRAAISSVTPTSTATRTPSPTPAFVLMTGFCTRGLEPCGAGTRMKVFRCPTRDGSPCRTEDAEQIAETATGGSGRYEVEIAREDIVDRVLVVEAEVDLQTTYRTLNFGSIVSTPQGGGTGTSPFTLLADVGPDSEAAVCLLEEEGIEVFDAASADALVSTVREQTAGLPPTLQELNILTPVEVVTAYTGEADADVTVRELLGKPTDTFLSVRFTSKNGCVETGQSARIGQGGFAPFLFVFTNSQGGRVDGFPLARVEEFFLVGQRRRDGTFRSFLAQGFDETRTGPFRGDLRVGSFNQGGVPLDLEIQLYIQRTDGSPFSPSLDGSECADPGPDRACAVCTVPLKLCDPGSGDEACFVDDVTIPDDTPVPRGTPFTKTWRLFNNGSRTWGAGYRYAFREGFIDGQPAAGDPLGGPPSIPVPVTAPGSSIDLSVDFVAPLVPGTYRSVWRLRNAAGQFFPEGAFVQIVVPE